MISAKFPSNKKRMNVLGQSMAYIEVGSGDPIVQEDSPDEIGQAIVTWMKVLQ